MDVEDGITGSWTYELYIRRMFFRSRVSMEKLVDSMIGY